MPIVMSTSWEGSAIAAIADKMPASKSRSWHQTAGRFVFKHRRSAHHLQQMSDLHREMRLEVEKSILISDPEEEVFSGYAGPLLEEFQFNLDGFLEAMRSAHDASLACLSSANLLIEPPHSFHDFYKKQTSVAIKTKMHDEQLLGILTAFWLSTGRVAKSYRDCLSHYVSLGGPTWQHSANAVFRRGAWTLTIALPDNPEARTYGALEFSGKIESLALCQRLQRESEGFVRQVLWRCAEKWETGPIDAETTRMETRSVVIGG